MQIIGMDSGQDALTLAVSIDIIHAVISLPWLRLNRAKHRVPEYLKNIIPFRKILNVYNRERFTDKQKHYLRNPTWLGTWPGNVELRLEPCLGSSSLGRSKGCMLR